jgi:hypothetical protein
VPNIVLRGPTPYSFRVESRRASSNAGFLPRPVKWQIGQRKATPVIRVDGSYLYRVGHQIHALAEFNTGTGVTPASTGFSTRIALYVAESALEPLLSQSVFRLRTCATAGAQLLNTIRELSTKIDRMSPEEKAKPLDFMDVYNITAGLTQFEAVLAAELAMSPLYVVTQTAGFDTAYLIDSGSALFPVDLGVKVPSALRDVENGTRCIAFELWTASGFHFHRANESVLRAYWDAVSGGKDRPENPNMGVLLAAMIKTGIGDPKVITSLRDLKDYHRNPLLHPEHSLESLDEAVALMNQVHNAMVNRDCPAGC